MIQVCDPPRQRQVRRLSAEEFCFLVRSEVSSVYRPYSEVLRMLTIGEVWGSYNAASGCGAAQLVLPLDADTAAAAALRACMGWRGVAGGCFLTPPAGQDPEQLPLLIHMAAARAEYLARGRVVRAVLEPTRQVEELLPLYLKQGFALDALRPLESLAPCFLLTLGREPTHTEPVWVPLADRAHLAFLLARGYAAQDSRPSPQGLVLAMYPA